MSHQDPLELARDALNDIALAGMSGCGQESEEGMRDWHARRAWEFIRIAARAKTAVDAAIAALPAPAPAVSSVDQHWLRLREPLIAALEADPWRLSIISHFEGADKPPAVRLHRAEKEWVSDGATVQVGGFLSGSADDFPLPPPTTVPLDHRRTSTNYYPESTVREHRRAYAAHCQALAAQPKAEPVDAILARLNPNLDILPGVPT